MGLFLIFKQFLFYAAQVFGGDAQIRSQLFLHYLAEDFGACAVQGYQSLAPCAVVYGGVVVFHVVKFLEPQVHESYGALMRLTGPLHEPVSRDADKYGFAACFYLVIGGLLLDE